MTFSPQRTMARKIKVRWVLGGLALAVATMLVLSMYGEYGGHNVSLAISRYMDRNEGRWPSSWRDIEPFHKDPLLSVQSTVVVRQFWDVNWNVDPQQLHRESLATPRPMVSLNEGVLPVVYNRGWLPEDRPVTRWVLSPLLQRHLDKKKEEERTTVEPSAPPPR
jgi:hypothetical protein